MMSEFDGFQKYNNRSDDDYNDSDDHDNPWDGWEVESGRWKWKWEMEVELNDSVWIEAMPIMAV